MGEPQPEEHPDAPQAQQQRDAPRQQDVHLRVGPLAVVQVVVAEKVVDPEQERQASACFRRARASKDAAVRPLADLAAQRVALPVPVLPPRGLRSPQQVRAPALWAQPVPVSLLPVAPLARLRVRPELERPVPQQEQERRPRVSSRRA